MIRVSLLFLVCFSTVKADSDDDPMVPTCERQSPHDIHFDLSKMGLTALRKGFMSSDLVTCINLAGNAISELEKGAFDGLPGLLYLNLAENSVSFEDFMGMKLQTLKALVLDGPFGRYGMIGEKHNPASGYYNKVINYDHNGEGETRLDNVPYIFLPSLEKLSFRDYEERAVFQWLSHINAPNLTHLHVGSNQFTVNDLPDNVKAGLTHLNVDNNKLNEVPNFLRKLRYLSMNRNEIHNLCVQNCDWNMPSVSDMPMLEHLSLADNQITTIEPNTFDNNIHLKYLNLDGNGITSLPLNLFHGVKLRVLKLRRNKLIEIPDICGIEELEVLDLGENLIGSIDEATFCNLTDLRSVDLHQNQLTNVPDATFAHLPELTELDLSRNQLTTLPFNWIGSGARLASLKLDGNLFDDLDNMSLGALEQLGNLSITDNPLRIVRLGALTGLPPFAQIKVCSAP